VFPGGLNDDRPTPQRLPLRVGRPLASVNDEEGTGSRGTPTRAGSLMRENTQKGPGGWQRLGESTQRFR